jgi:Flp pilus assembly protein TadG
MTTRPGVTDRGSATIETAILAPAFLLFLGLIIGAGRVAIAHQGVEAAAAEAARAASMARTASQAYSGATTDARQALANEGVRCVSLTVGVDTSGFAVPAGTATWVKATLSCVVNLADLSVPGMPGTIVVTASVTSPLDTYRGR